MPTNRIEISYDEEHRVFVAKTPDLPSAESPHLQAFGGTREEALREIEIVEKLYYRDQLRRKALEQGIS